MLKPVQLSALKTTSLARTTTYLVGPGGSDSSLLLGLLPGGSQLRGTQIGFGGTGTRWVPALLYVGPYTPFGFYNAN